MARVPPALLYLTIYNPSLRPTGPIASDDEDAEEQAHILFYTSRERAVSRDRMLRQVGLAKALVNFSEMFSAEEPCNNVHSQSRRMIMVSPEQDFWIHATIDLAKTPRPSLEKAKGKEKSKTKQKGKDNQQQPIGYDYHDGTLHDLALRGHILRGYEQFKLTHGSFTSVLNTLGQQALELQLERFFTVWAWSWNPEDGHEFGEHLGIPLHPLYRVLVPALDDFSSHIPGTASIIITPPYIIPSDQFINAEYPTSLPRYLISLMPQYGTSPKPTASEITVTPARPSDVTDEHAGWVPQKPSAGTEANASNGKPNGGSNHTFLGIPPMTINMDVRKWAWPFGKNNGKKPPDAPRSELNYDEEDKKQEQQPAEDQRPASDTEEDRANLKSTEVDTVSLMDAIESENVHGSRGSNSSGDMGSMSSRSPSAVEPSALSEETPGSSPSEGLPDTHDATTPPRDPIPSFISDTLLLSGDTAQMRLEADQGSSVDESRANEIPPNGHALSDTSGNEVPSLAFPTSSSQIQPTADSSQASPSPRSLEFSSITVHLADNESPLATRRRKIIYLTEHGLTAAFVEEVDEDDHPTGPSVTVEEAVRLLHDIRNTINSAECNGGLDASLPSATKILQPKDKHIICTGSFTTSSPGFESHSEHLYNGKLLLESDADILEVFSRGQHPQHWHVARRGLGVDAEGKIVDGEVYMEIERKEISLNDADNVLSGIVRRFTG